VGSYDRPVPVAPEVTEQTEIVLIGGRVDAGTLVEAYRQGLFPMEVDVAPEESLEAEPMAGSSMATRPTRPPASVLAWFCPDPRGVLPYPGMHVSKSVRRAQRELAVTVDEDFAGVLAGCADPARPHGWITPAYREAYRDLHESGVAHSVEVWQCGELVGGLLGVELGGTFCADSKFHRVTNASKVALAELSRRVFAGADAPRRLIDVQWCTQHLASLGCREVSRDEYLRTMPGRLDLPTVLS
jgi:leucyl/phenylalanyl-tRNA--protein transferase